jgi:threonine/homoserine/homoserine lactone efflux protein
VLVVPLAWQASEINTRTLVAVVSAFAVTTLTTMVAVTWLGLRGTARLDRPFLARYGEAVSGGIIAATGIAILVMR